MHQDRIDIRRMPAEREEPKDWNPERDFPQEDFEVVRKYIEDRVNAEDWGEVMEFGSLVRRIDPARYEKMIRPIIFNPANREKTIAGIKEFLTETISPDSSLPVTKEAWLAYLWRIHRVKILDIDREASEPVITDALAKIHKEPEEWRIIRGEIASLLNTEEPYDYPEALLRVLDLKSSNPDQYTLLVQGTQFSIRNIWQRFSFYNKYAGTTFLRVRVAALLKEIDPETFEKEIHDAPTIPEVRKALQKHEGYSEDEATEVLVHLEYLLSAKILLSDVTTQEKSEALPTTRSY